MVRLTDLVSYRDAQAAFSRDRLWQLFDGDRERLNIGHECLERHRDKGVAIRIAYADGRETALSFAELSDLSARFANYLVDRGIRPGDRVAIMLEPSPAFYLALFGAMLMGAVAVPLFTAFGTDGLRVRLDDCTPAMLVIAPEKAALAQSTATMANAAMAVVVADDEFVAGLGDFAPSFAPTTGADDMAMYQYTSGTTRQMPEAVKHRHRAVVTVAIAALYGTGVRPGDRFMCPSSPAWGHGLWHGTLAPLALGVSIAAWSGPFDPSRFLAVLADWRITNLSAAATHYRLIKNCGEAPNHQYAIEKLSFTGEPIDTATAEFVEATFGRPVCSIYGTTEIGVILVDYPGAPDHRVKPGALGRPVPGVELQVQDRDGRPCPPGVIGEIKLRRKGGWFPTKDRGSVDQDGYYFHAGRADDVIISAGWTMSAVEIENVLLAHDDVDEAAAIGVADALRGQVVKAYIVSCRTGDADFARELQDFTRERLSRHEYPRLVEFTARLPKTPAGKLNRQALRRRAAAASPEDAPKGQL